MSVSGKMMAIADAIRVKTGKSEPLTLDAMASEIAGIQAGSAASVQSGNLTLDSRLAATVNCGFQPDVVAVYFYLDEKNSTESVVCFFFPEQIRPDIPFMAYGVHDSDKYEARAVRSASGFTVTFKSTPSDVGKNLKYTAVKYTQ